MRIEHGSDQVMLTRHAVDRYRERHLLLEESAYSNGVIRLRIVEELRVASQLNPMQALAFLGTRRRSLDPACSYWRWADRVFVLLRGTILLTILRIDEPLDRLLDTLEEYQPDDELTLS